MNSQPPPPLGDALRDALPTYEAPERLRAWARARASSGAVTDDRASKFRRLGRFAYAAGIVAAAAAGWSGKSLVSAARGDSDRQNEVVAALVDSHVRSLLADHLTDVLSSDRHTVKPWFAGKVEFAPHVPELAAQGFPLIGGRVEYVAGHTAAALVYGRRLHTINLFIWPKAPSDGAAPAASHNGYSLLHWADQGLTYWAVSDVPAVELEAFKSAYAASAIE